jgi:hypothetical protein
VTRQSAASGVSIRGKLPKKASLAETTLLKALGISPANLEVNDADLGLFRQLFDSPLREEHLRVVASIFGKSVPRTFVEDEPCQVLVTTQ